MRKTQRMRQWLAPWHAALAGAVEHGIARVILYLHIYSTSTVPGVWGGGTCDPLVTGGGGCISHPRRGPASLHLYISLAAHSQTIFQALLGPDSRPAKPSRSPASWKGKLAPAPVAPLPPPSTEPEILTHPVTVGCFLWCFCPWIEPHLLREHYKAFAFFLNVFHRNADMFPSFGGWGGHMFFLL